MRWHDNKGEVRVQNPMLFKQLAQKGAEIRLRELEEERTALLRAFPSLRGSQKVEGNGGLQGQTAKAVGRPKGSKNLPKAPLALKGRPPLSGARRAQLLKNLEKAREARKAKMAGKA